MHQTCHSITSLPTLTKTLIKVMEPRCNAQTGRDFPVWHTSLSQVPSASPSCQQGTLVTLTASQHDLEKFQDFAQTYVQAALMEEDRKPPAEILHGFAAEQNCTSLPYKLFSWERKGHVRALNHSHFILPSFWRLKMHAAHPRLDPLLLTTCYLQAAAALVGKQKPASRGPAWPVPLDRNCTALQSRHTHAVCGCDNSC